MIEIKLNNWDEKDLQCKVVEKVAEQVIRREFKLYGNIPEEGCYTPYDKFKNYIANLVADRIFKYIINNDEINTRINKAIERAEKVIVDNYFKSVNKVSDKNGGVRKWDVIFMYVAKEKTTKGNGLIVIILN